jgi:hypothetical protein
MTPEAAALVALVHLAYAEVEKRQAALPPPTNDRERLERLLDIDQAGRNAMQTIDLSQLSEEDQEERSRISPARSPAMTLPIRRR